MNHEGEHTNRKDTHTHARTHAHTHTHTFTVNGGEQVCMRCVRACVCVCVCVCVYGVCVCVCGVRERLGEWVCESALCVLALVNLGASCFKLETGRQKGQIDRQTD